MYTQVNVHLAFTNFSVRNGKQTKIVPTIYMYSICERIKTKQRQTNDKYGSVLTEVCFTRASIKYVHL